MKRIILLLLTTSLAAAAYAAATPTAADRPVPATEPAGQSVPASDNRTACTPATDADAASDTPNAAAGTATAAAATTTSTTTITSTSSAGTSTATTTSTTTTDRSASASWSGSTASSAPMNDDQIRAQLRKQRFLPTRRRMDREIDKLKYAYKGEVAIGLTASYGTLSSDNADVLTILSSLSADGTIATVKPSFGYFYRDNHCLGVRFGYSHMSGTLDGRYDLGESNDFSGTLPYLDISSNNYSFGIYHRSYAGLDPKGRFGLFAEFELSVATGSSNDAHKRDGEIIRVYSDNTRLKLAFNPGAAVYIFPNVCATISFGLGGIQYASVTQKNEAGQKIGSRKASNMRFRLNVAAINFGMTIHLWDKKKQ